MGTPKVLRKSTAAAWPVIWYLYDVTGQDDSTAVASSARSLRVCFSESVDALGAHVRERTQLNELAVEHEDGPVRRATEPHRAFRDRVKYGLHISRRAGDRLENLARRHQIPVACLQLVEQAHILDGNHRLVGEGLEERNLRRRERPR